MKISDTVSIDHNWVSTLVLLDHLKVIGEHSQNGFAQDGEVFVPENRKAAYFRQIRDGVNLQLENSKVYFIVRKDSPLAGKIVGEFMRDTVQHLEELNDSGVNVYYPPCPTAQYLRVGYRLNDETRYAHDVVRLIAMKVAATILIENFNEWVK